MNSLKLTVYRGAKEIGGNCVLVETDNTRLLIDFGAPLAGKDGEQFDRKILEYPFSKLIDDGVFKRIEGLYREEYRNALLYRIPILRLLVGAKKINQIRSLTYNGTGKKIDAILISHSHLDHIGFLKYASDKIPIYLGDGTERIIFVSNIFLPYFEIRNKIYKKIKSQRKEIIGDFNITPFSVDHSAFDSYAYLVNFKNINILYTGDFRLHGRNPEMYKRMVEALKGVKIDYLIIEGTHIETIEAGYKTEEDVENEIYEHIINTPNMVLANFSPQNVDRLLSFFNAAKRAGRCFIIDEYCALITHMIQSLVKVPTPQRDEAVLVYFREHFLNSYKRRNLGKIYNLFVKKSVDYNFINENQNKIVMLFRPSMLRTDFQKIKVKENSTLIYSYHDVYLTKPEYQKLNVYLKEHNIAFKKAHASGHVYVRDMIEFAKEIRPRYIIPIHTFAPAKFRDHFESVIQLEDGKTFEVS